MRNRDVGRCEVVQLVLVGFPRRSPCEVVGHVGEVHQESHRVNQNDRADALGNTWYFEKVRCDDTAVGLRHELELVPAVAIHDLHDFRAQCLLILNFARDARTDGHDLNGDNAYLAFCGITLPLVDHVEEIDVWVQAYANAMNKDDRLPGCRGVRFAPV